MTPGEVLEMHEHEAATFVPIWLRTYDPTVTDDELRRWLGHTFSLDALGEAIDVLLGGPNALKPPSLSLLRLLNDARRGRRMGTLRRPSKAMEEAGWRAVAQIRDVMERG